MVGLQRTQSKFVNVPKVLAVRFFNFSIFHVSPSANLLSLEKSKNFRISAKKFDIQTFVRERLHRACLRETKQ